MPNLIALWLPVLVGSLVVFGAGFVLYMVLPYHRTDFRGIPEEEKFRALVGEMNLARGQYAFPEMDEGGPKAYEAKLAAGPAGFLLVGKNSPDMTRRLSQHFVHILVLTVIVAYLASSALPTGTEYLTVFRVVGTSALLAYAGALATFSIWYGFSWAFALKFAVDGFVYALLTAGVFGWLWP